MQGKQNTHEEFLNNLLNKNTEYASGKIEFLSDYKGSFIKMKIKIVGDDSIYEMTPQCLLRNHPITIFAAQNKTEVFKKQLLLKNKFYKNGDFEVIGEYINSKTNILIKDKFGYCEMIPSTLLKGANSGILSAVNKTEYSINGFGTLKINNFKLSSWKKNCPGNPGILYVIKCYNDDEEFIKIGITCNTIKRRYDYESLMPYKYTIIHSITSYNRDFIWKLEKALLKITKLQIYKPKISFAGETECRNIETIHTILKILENEKINI